MLEACIQTLDKEKQKAIESVQTTCSDKEMSESAVYVIKVHYSTIKNFLKTIADKGFEVNDDLSRIDKDYESNETYRKFMTRIENHLWRLQQIPIKVQKGKFDLEKELL